jgi:hypothetical protein
MVMTANPIDARQSPSRHDSFGRLNSIETSKDFSIEDEERKEDGPATDDAIDHAKNSRNAREPPEPTSTQDGSKSRLQQCFAILSEQWFLIALGILIAFASQIQVPMAHQEQKRTLTSYLCISIIFFV